MNHLISTIANSVKNGKCVFILGPDLYLKEYDKGVTLDRKTFFAELEGRTDGLIYFPSEDVFDFSTSLQWTVRKEVSDFYEGTGDVNLWELISSIKLPLILNTSPDLSLKNFCDRNEIPLQFDSFHGFNDENNPVEFNLENPLLYNLFGNSGDMQELILDYKHLFKHIQKILPEHSLPLAIRSFLSNASCFIFLGFKFNSWIFQLLSYKILSHKNDSTSSENRIRLGHLGLDEENLREIKERMTVNALKSRDLNKENAVNIIMASSVGMEFTNDSPSQLLAKILDELKRKPAVGKSHWRDLKAQERYSCYLSYAHYSTPAGDTPSKVKLFTEILTQRFYDHLQESSLRFEVDKKALHYGQSIDSFMTRIGRGKTVVIVLSDRYLKSKYCLTELVRIFKYNNCDKRIFILKLNDLNADRAVYINYWKDKLKSLISESKVDVGEVGLWLEIIYDFDGLMNKLDDILYLPISLADFETSSMDAGNDSSKLLEPFINEVINKMKE